MPEQRSLLGGVRDRVNRVVGRMPISARLAGVTALLTFVILFSFAAVVGELTVSRIRSDFNRQLSASANYLANHIRLISTPGAPNEVQLGGPPLDVYAAAPPAVIRVMTMSGDPVGETTGAPDLGQPFGDGSLVDVNGYRVDTEVFPTRIGSFYVQYARPVSELDATVARVRLLLVIGVLAGTGLALLAGMMIARRAMSPITRLTQTAAEIARTRDLRRTMPEPEADDEVAELARTLQGMLAELDDARTETEEMLRRQRRFVADASHELRTPLTSVLANLELLAESLRGEQGEAARSALRSSQRMRRLVTDLLLLARSDAGRNSVREPTDLARVAIEAAAELGPIAHDHHIHLDAEPATVNGARDELHRVALNLMENAIHHTPPGTSIEVSTRTLPDGQAELVVADDGPGIPPEVRPRLFERFVRGAGETAGSSGLGLAIVRAVTEGHGGTVWVQDPPGRGSRFVVRLPALAATDMPAPTPAITA